MQPSKSPRIIDLIVKLDQLDQYLENKGLRLEGKYLQGESTVNHKATEIIKMSRSLKIDLSGGGDFITQLIPSMGYQLYSVSDSTVGIHLKNGYITF